MKKNANRILITGGTGFIGTHLVDRLVVHCPETHLEIVDDLSSSSVTSARFGFFQQHGITFRQMSVEDFIPAKVRYSYIYHLACRVGPAHVLNYMGRMGGEIVNDAMKMAHLALRDNAPLISISTSEVYGRDPEGRPQHEDLTLEVPSQFSARLEYTIAKLMTEISLMNLAAITPLRVNLIRPFNIVGPHQTGEGGFVLPRFVEAALRDEPITVFGDGSQTRAFTHVSDLVEALIRIMESDVNRRVYNVGSPENTCTIMALAERVIALTGSESEVRCVDPKVEFGQHYADAPSKVPCVSRIQAELGWQSTWPLDDIVRDYARFALRQTATEAIASTSP